MTTTDDVKRICPLPTSVLVNVIPNHQGDAVVIAAVDAQTGGRHLMVLDAQTAHQLGTDLLFATTDDGIAEQADRIRKQQ